MTGAGDYECRLLADLLPSCVRCADYFASSDERAAVEACAGADAFTFYQNLSYEFCRVQAGQYETSDGYLSVPGVGVLPLLEMLERRTARPSLLPIWLRKSTFQGLELLRRDAFSVESLKFEVLCQRLRLSTSSPKSRKHIINCLAGCNPELPPPLEPIQGGDSLISGAKALKSSLIRVSRLAACSHRLLCENWACACLPPGSHVAVKLLLGTYRKNEDTNAVRFELLLSTSDLKYPWQETELDAIVDPISIEEQDATAGEEVISRRTHVRWADSPRAQDRIANLKRGSGKHKRWQVENICKHIHQTLGTRFRLLVEGSSIWRLSPTHPRIQNLRNAVHISLSELIHRGCLKRLTQKDRFLLTYTIANGILTLYQGPWVDHQWTKDQIFFLCQNQDSKLPDLTKPLLAAKCISTDHGDSLLHPDNIHPEPRVAALGIVMLEIASGIAIESCRDDGPLNSNTDLLNACRMMEQMRRDKNSIPQHILAIRNCLQPEDIFDEESSNESIQHSLHTSIVGPLKSILSFYGLNTGDSNLTLGEVQHASSPIKRSSVESREPEPGGGQFTSSINPIYNHPELPGLSSLNTQEAVDSIAAEKWFSELESRVLPLFTDKPERTVKVAILDSGIELPDENYFAYEHRLKYKSWIKGDETIWTDRCGHGTHAAGLFLKVSPYAELCVARITQDGTDLDPNIIAAAIRHAIDEWDVDIISMSFGFSQLEPAIDEALKYAVNQNRILLAAASNEGLRHDIAWPARSAKVICIHSLHGDGDHSSYTPEPRAQDFGILGQAVSSFWPPHLNAGRFVLRSGTSCATPIAAGVAALLVEYAQEKLLARPGSKTEEYVIRNLRSNASMRILFQLMAKKPRDGQHCIIPWKLLDHKKKEQVVCDKIWEKLLKHS